MKALSPKGGAVLDPCCGSGTTAVACEHLGRSWIGIDQSLKAIEVTRQRVLDDRAFNPSMEEMFGFPCVEESLPAGE